jgi:hypothetical protein
MAKSVNRVLQVSSEEHFYLSDAILPGFSTSANRGALPSPRLWYPGDGRIRIEAVKGPGLDLDADRLSLVTSPIGQALTWSRRRPIV